MRLQQFPKPLGTAAKRFCEVAEKSLVPRGVAPFMKPVTRGWRSGRAFGPAPYCPHSGHSGLISSLDVHPIRRAPFSFSLFCADLQRTSALSHPDTHHHPRWCLSMPLPENTTISLQGHSRPEDALHSKPKQAIFLRMSAETLEALQASPLPQVQFTFGKRSVSSIPTARSLQLDPLLCRAYKWEIPFFRRSRLPRMQSMIYTSAPLPQDRRIRHSNTTQRSLESSWYNGTVSRR